jgi:hypothetical protein
MRQNHRQVQMLYGRRIMTQMARRFVFADCRVPLENKNALYLLASLARDLGEAQSCYRQ